MFRKMTTIKKKGLGIGRPASAADITYACGHLQIRLPQGHTLPKYQSRHPDYNRFLPHLARYVDGNATIIDVGANCGYVVAAMAQQNEQAAYICIEPDEHFLWYLNLNMDILRSRHPHVQVAVCKELVGKIVKDAVLKNSGGTSVAVLGTGCLTAKPLDDIMTGFAGSRVRLLKSDVDGFDYDVLDSARQLIVSQNPAVYFECQHEHDDQKKGFEATIAWLSEVGYVRWAIFDNYGAFIMAPEDVGAVLSLMNYVMKQNEGRATRTMYYLDILCVCSKDMEMMSAALATY
jgi:FkbM family methyltransferase